MDRKKSNLVCSSPEFETKWQYLIFFGDIYFELAFSFLLKLFCGRNKLSATDTPAEL